MSTPVELPPTPPPPNPARHTPPSPNQPISLEVLRTLHQACLTRWTNRRDYEWKLSYAFWTAIAGYITFIVFGKDSRFSEPPPKGYLLVWLFLMIAFHVYYLINMIDRTLNDVEAQSDIELVIHGLDPYVAQKLRKIHLGGSMKKYTDDPDAEPEDRSWFYKHYGLWSQAGITVLLSFAAWWVSYHTTKGGPPPENKIVISEPIKVTWQPPPTSQTTSLPVQQAKPPASTAKPAHRSSSHSTHK